MSEEKEVITVDDISEKNAPTIYVKGGLNQFLEAVKVEVATEVPDLTTKKGRDRIASQAFKVSKSKAAVEKHGRAYLARLKEMPKVIEAELRDFVRAMDALRDETRAPLTAWEEAEEARVTTLENRLSSLKNLNTEGMTAGEIGARVQDLDSLEVGSDWEEFEAEAHRVKAASLATLREAMAIREKHEAELAAIAKFQAEQAERDAQAERDRIAQEAADRATREAEQRAQAERDAAAKREAELVEKAAQAERDAAAKREAELVEKAAQAQRQADQDKRDAAAAAEQARLNAELAEQRRIAAERQAEIDRVAAEQRQAEAVERAAQAERQRQADEQARVEAETKAREADRAHKGATLKAAKEAIMKTGITEEQAVSVIKLIAAGKVPAVSIQY